MNSSYLYNNKKKYFEQPKNMSSSINNAIKFNSEKIKNVKSKSIILIEMVGLIGCLTWDGNQIC